MSYHSATSSLRFRLFVAGLWLFATVAPIMAEEKPAPEITLKFTEQDLVVIYRALSAATSTDKGEAAAVIVKIYCQRDDIIDRAFADCAR